MVELLVYAFFLAPLVSLPFLLSLWKEYLEEKRVKQMEKMLPNFLDKMSHLPATVSFRDALEILSRNSDPLSKELLKCLTDIKRGLPPELALNQMNFGNSLTLGQSKKILVQFYRNGLPAGEVLSEVAEQITALQEVTREAEASTSLQKYSLLLSSAVLIPVIIALLYSISLQASSLLSFLATASNEVQSAVFISVNIYLVVFSLLVSFFVARQAGRAKSFVTYFLSTAPLALLVFHAVVAVSSNVF